MRIRWRPILTLSLSGLLSGFTACELDLRVNNGSSSVPAELDGKSFQDGGYVEPSAANPQTGSSGSTHRGFSSGVVDGEFLLAASFRNAAFDSIASNSFPLYYRSYSVSSGWGSIGGPNFFIALSGNDEQYRDPVVGLAPSSGRLITAYSADAMTAESSEYDGTSWGAQDSLSDPGLAGREYPTNEWWDDFPRSSMVTDTVGRTYVSSINDTDPDDDSVVMFWRAATGYSAMLQGLDGRAHLRHSKILFDGVSRVCQLREVDNAGNHDLVAYCADASVAVGTDPTFVTSTAGGLDATGHDEATDGAGQIVSVFYGEFGGTWGVYSWFANNGTWDVVPTRIDGSGIATGFVSAGDSAEPGGAVFPGGTRPAVAHLGK